MTDKMVKSFDIDRQAWEKAKAELSPNAPVSNIALRAQEIKKELLNAINDKTSGRVVTSE